MPDDVLIPDQDDAQVGIVAQVGRRLHRDLRADAIGIADRQRDGLGMYAHSGSANRVSKRELSQTTIRSLSFGAPPLSL